MNQKNKFIELDRIRNLYVDHRLGSHYLRCFCR